MLVSVVVCTHSTDRFEVFFEAVESVLAQRHRPLGVVLLVDGNPELAAWVRERFGDAAERADLDRLVIDEKDENRGISYSCT